MTVDPLDAWGALRSAGFVRRFVANEVVFEEGDAADGAYVVLAGRFAVLEHGDAVAMLAAGELFGEIGALGEGVRSATVVTVDEGELLYLSLEQLRDGFASSPELFWASLRLIVQRLRSVAARQVAYREEHKALREV